MHFWFASKVLINILVNRSLLDHGLSLFILSLFWPPKMHFTTEQNTSAIKVHVSCTFMASWWNNLTDYLEHLYIFLPGPVRHFYFVCGDLSVQLLCRLLNLAPYVSEYRGRPLIVNCQDESCFGNLNFIFRVGVWESYEGGTFTAGRRYHGQGERWWPGIL